MTTLHDFSADALTGEPHDLSEYQGQVVLVVNTASKCGLTPQYEGLQSLFDRYRDQGLVVAGFPCNQFAGQEPGDAEQVGEFCQRNYGVSFPMFAKVDVNGSDAHPLWKWLRQQKSGVFGDTIKWNFTKFLVGRDGQVLQRFAPTTKPEELVEPIEKALAR